MYIVMNIEIDDCPKVTIIVEGGEMCCDVHSCGVMYIVMNIEIDDCPLTSTIPSV